jgi:uncharacterized membrane protein YidH (DUF202 family)
MARALIGIFVLTLIVALAVGLAIKRRQRLRDVFRQNGDRLVLTAKGLAIVLLLLAFAVLIVVNN